MTLVARWRCLDKTCPAHVPTVVASMAEADKASTKHTKDHPHATEHGIGPANKEER
jgi:hypothetical protein